MIAEMSEQAMTIPEQAIEAVLYAAAKACRDKYCELLPGKRTWDALSPAEKEIDVICLKAALPLVGVEQIATVSPSDPRVIIAGIRQFGLASDGSDLRDLEAAFIRHAHAGVEHTGLPRREEIARLIDGPAFAKLAAVAKLEKAGKNSLTISRRADYEARINSALNLADVILSLFARQEAPDHTDLMVVPESIDAFMEANPLPNARQEELPETFAGVGPDNAGQERRVPGGETRDEIIAWIKAGIDTRLNDYLCEMREGYDDSIVGFNEAWDVIRKMFAEPFLSSPAPASEGSCETHTQMIARLKAELGTPSCPCGLDWERCGRPNC